MIQTLQRQENAAMRRMLQAPRYATIAGMRGEIGISSMKSRIARSRIQYVRRKMQGEESLVRGTMEEMRARGDEWWKRTVRYMDWAGVKVEELSVITQQEVKSRDCAEGWRGVGGRDARKDDAVDVQGV